MRVGALLVGASLSVAACGARTPLDEIGEEARALDAGTRTDARADAGPRADARPGDAGPSCSVGISVPRPAPADLVFVVDRSGSMSETFEGATGTAETSRWALLGRAVEAATDALDPRVRVGATFFPNPHGRPRMDLEEPCRTTVGFDVDPSATGRDEMLAIFDRTAPTGGTPTADAIFETHRWLARSPIAHRAMVLATDGAPNCNPDLTTPGCVCTVVAAICDAAGGGVSCLDDLRTIALVAESFAAGIPVYVVGIDDEELPEYREVLDQMAIAGGRAREGTGRRFYDVATAEQLATALTEITAEVAACGLVLSSLPPTDDLLEIAIDGVIVPFVDGDGDGWTWARRATGELELVGAACDALRAGGDVTLRVDGCE